MRLLDLFCGAGGCSKGYNDAGFEVLGVDIERQPEYPFRFVQRDALQYLATTDLSGFDLIHASPPCQAYSFASAHHRNRGKEYPDLLPQVRAALMSTGKPFVIENVVGAPLYNPIQLDGLMFGLKVLRRRLFETNWPLKQPPKSKVTGGVKRFELCTVAGHGGHGPNNLITWSLAMGIHWMSKKKLTQAIPPKYTEYIGREFCATYIRKP